MAGLVPAIPARRTPESPERDTRDKPGHDNRDVFAVFSERDGYFRKGSIRSSKSIRASAMILGLSVSAFTTVHTILSLIGTATGIIAVIGMLGSKKLNGWTAAFVLTSILTSLTGFFFPFTNVLPSHIVGGVSLLVLAIVLFGLYVRGLERAWRWIYVVGVLIALCLNVFVAVVQAFQKIGFVKALAPTQSEPPFLIAQLVVLAVFVVLGFVAVKKFHPEAMPA
jgi:hypothetical protein